MAQFETVIGLEIHAQLRTNSKIFCACSTQFGADPNENVCPVCAGMPGVLPVLNQRAVEFAIKMALAVDCRVNNRSVFARKNYFYPDLPKGYQISQYEQPVAEHGHIDIVTEAGKKVIGITRIHMEEDAGKSIHVPADNASLVDLNRTGVPLIEIVSEPDMRSPEEAVAYLKALRSILVYLGICDGNMEEGSFRCDANVSLRPRGESALGTRTELKNMNSFRHVQKALEFEVKRQTGLLEDGEAVIQETRLFDADKGVTKPMRGKEEAHDYRYFPDPDLMPLLVSDIWVEEVRATLPELPAKKKERFVADFGLQESDAVLLTSERELADYFEAAVRVYPEPKKIGNWMMSDFLRLMNEENIPASKIPMAPEHLAGLVKLVESGVISGKIGKSIFPDLFRQGLDPEVYVRDKGLVQISDTSSLEATVDEIVAAHPEETAAYRAGKTKLMGFFVGQVMKQTKGQANPKLLNEILIKKLA